MGVGDQANPSVFSYVALSKEATFATYASASTAVEALQCSFMTSIKSQKIDAMFANRGYYRRVALEREVKGTLDQYLHPQESVLLLANALAGQISSTAATNSTVHSISAGNFQNSIASLSFNVRKGGAAGNPAAAALTWRYQGGRCNQMKMVGEIGQPVKVSYDFVFQDSTQVSDDISAILSLSSVAPYTFIGGVMKYGSSEGSVAQENITHFELTVNNNIKSDKEVRALGTATVMVLPATRREITLKTTQRFDTTTVYNRFIQATEGAIELAFSGAAIVAATTVSEYFFTMNIRLPRVVQKTGDVDLKGPGEILAADLEWDVLLDSPSTSTGRDIGLTVRNSTASY